MSSIYTFSYKATLLHFWGEHSCMHVYACDREGKLSFIVFCKFLKLNYSFDPFTLKSSVCSKSSYLCIIHVSWKKLFCDEEES